ncbi:MAG: MmgE/PrpD family protein [Desulfobacteraceae bacterium]|nr:MmgE/PrpD family protein [Desulfobacteraceae bacterium]
MREEVNHFRKPVEIPAIEPMEQLAQFIVETDYEDLPPGVVEYIKKLFLDTLGITIGGSLQEAIPEIVGLVKSWGGAEQSTILIYGGKVPAPNAAFAIGPMTRALDMGDTHPQACHISEYVVPALLPAAELRGGVSGKEFITAYALAAELGGRIGNACHCSDAACAAGRHPQLGHFEATTAVGKLFGLDKATMQNALGIAFHLINARDEQMYVERNLMVRVHHAFTCRDAINAVLLAQIGVTGAHKVFTGQKGLFNIDYVWESEYEPLTKGLGKTWELFKVNIKLYASLYGNHSPISGAMDLIKGNNIDIADIAEIRVELDPANKRAGSEPAEVAWNPQTMVEAQFSTPFAISTAIIKGKIFIDDYTPGELHNKDVRALMPKVKCAVNETLAAFGSIVTIRLKDGAKYTKRTAIEEIKGGFLNPLTWDEIVDKFRLMPPFSAVEIPQRNIDQLIEKCKGLEVVSDMSDIINLMTPEKNRNHSDL